LLFNYRRNFVFYHLISFVVVVEDIIQGILLVVDKAVEESDHAFCVCTHESEELRHNFLFVILKVDLVGKHKLEKHLDFLMALVHAEKNFWLYVEHVA